MYNTESLTQATRFELDGVIYAGIIRRMESLRFMVDAIGVDQGVHHQFSVISELVNWYCDNVIVSGAYLRDELVKLQQLIRWRSTW